MEGEKTGRDLHPSDRPFNTTTPPQTPLAHTDHVGLARFGAQKATKVTIMAKSAPFGVWLWTDGGVNGKSEKTGRDLHPSNRPFNTTTPPQTPLAYTDHVDLGRFGAQSPPKGRFGVEPPSFRV